MTPFVVLALFGFIQAGLSDSLRRRDDGCVNNNDEVIRLYGFNCEEMTNNPFRCVGDDVKAACPEQCDLRCHKSSCEGFNCNSGSGDFPHDYFLALAK